MHKGICTQELLLGKAKRLCQFCQSYKWSNDILGTNQEHSKYIILFHCTAKFPSVTREKVSIHKGNSLVVVKEKYSVFVLSTGSWITGPLICDLTKQENVKDRRIPAENKGRSWSSLPPQFGWTPLKNRKVLYGRAYSCWGPTADSISQNPNSQNLLKMDQKEKVREFINLVSKEGKK